MEYRILYFFSISSPWSYIGHRTFVDIAARHGASIAFKPVALQKLFPESGGLPLAKRHPSRQAYRIVELQRWRERRNCPLELRPVHWPLKSDLPDRIVLAAALQGADPEPFVRNAFAALWTEQQDLTDSTVLEALVSKSGIDRALVGMASSEQVETRFAGNLETALQCGVFGAPSYVFEGEVFWGQDRLELLDDMLTRRRAPFLAHI